MPFLYPPMNLLSTRRESGICVLDPSLSFLISSSRGRRDRPGGCNCCIDSELPDLYESTLLRIRSNRLLLPIQVGHRHFSSRARGQDLTIMALQFDTHEGDATATNHPPE